MVFKTQPYTTLPVSILIHEVVLFCACVLCGCTPSESQSESRPIVSNQIELESAQYEVIYGEDTRQDVYEVNTPLLSQIAQRSVLAMFNNRSLRLNEETGRVSPIGSPLGQQYRLCEDQRYLDQITAASCSATLIDDNIIVTAGHCVETQAECESKKFVLGYYMNDIFNLAPISVEQVFACERLLISRNTRALDFAFIQLDRPVTSMLGEPAAITQVDAPVMLDEPVTLMGFPSGLPLKVDAGGFVSDPRGQSPPLNYFRATVDAFGGNSGSGVFNSVGEQVGILVRGETDYIPSARQCTVVNELSLERGPGDDAEEITYLSRAINELCETGFVSERLCSQSQGGLCTQCETNTDCIDDYQCGQFQQYPEAPSFCAPACESDDTCPSNHLCVLGQCTPSESRLCDGDQVISVDSCGRTLGVVEVCSEETYCRRGRCLPVSMGDQCSTAISVESVRQSINGSFQEGFTPTTVGSCGGEGPEIFYRFDLSQANRLVATSRGLDTVLHLRTDCLPSDELRCVDDSRPPGRYGSQIDLQLESGSYILVVDSYNPEERGEFTLDIELCPDICVLGSSRCISSSEAEICEINEEGCIIWQSISPCVDGAICTDGRCIAPQPGDNCKYAESISFDEAFGSNIVEGVINDAHTLAVGSQCSPMATRDRLYRFELEQASILNAETIGEGVSALSLNLDCLESANTSTELSCTPANSDILTLEERLPAGQYTVIVTADSEASYELIISTQPDCIDECDLELEPFCSERESSDMQSEVVKECILAVDGCAYLEITDDCAGRVCAGGQCLEECFNTCQLGQRECVDAQSVISCVSDERGCLFWEETEVCEANSVCAGEGQCVEENIDWGVAGTEAGTENNIVAGEDVIDIDPPIRQGWDKYSGPKAVYLPDRQRGGCQQIATSFSPIWGLILLSLLSVYRRRVWLK